LATIRPIVTTGVEPGRDVVLQREHGRALRLSRRERFANTVGDGLEVDRAPVDLLEQLVGRRLLPFRPELADQRAGVLRVNQAVAELLAQERAQLRLERQARRYCDA